jgi:hypothetical protein
MRILEGIFNSAALQAMPPFFYRASPLRGLPVSLLAQSNPDSKKFF